MSSLKDHLDKLASFVTVARSQSLTRAARALNVSQPALSHTIKTLEEALGKPLLVRSSRGIRLTDAGRALDELARRVLDETTALEERLRSVGGDKLSIGTKAPYAVHLWPRYLDALYREFPALEIGLHVERSNAALLEGLESRRFDLVFLPEPGDGVDAYEICRDGYAFYTAAEDGATTGIEARPLILFSSALGGGRRTLGELLADFRPTRVLEVDSFDAAAAMADEGLGLAVLPRMLGDAAAEAGKLRRARVEGIAPDLFPEMRICLCAPTWTPSLRRIARVLRATEKAARPAPTA